MTSLIYMAKECLQAKGGRMTNQRKSILSVLDTLSGHPTAEEVYRLAKKKYPDVHLSTIYRTLRWLQDEGLLSTQSFAEDTRKERFDPNLSADHAHFLCTKCKKVVEFSEGDLLAEIMQQFESRTKFKVEQVSLTLYGICKDCK
ncbi:MAG: Fur family transcriptional regulator [Chloroflexota bacterium]